MEIPYHSIHYIDLIQSFYGDPRGMYAKTVKHPKSMDLAPLRTTMASVMIKGQNPGSSTLPTGVEDAYQTMAYVEATYISSEKGGVPLPSGT